jgi:hypothetical protein
MRVAERIDTDTTEEVEVALAFVVPQVNALPARKEHGVTVVGLEQK